MKDLGLKWHVFGRLTIIYILVFACAIIPVTASKFISKALGGDSARVARFDAGSVSFGEGPSADELYATEGGIQYYAFKGDFTVTFAPSDVSREFSLKIYLDKNYSAGITMFACPESLPESGDDYQFVKPNPNITSDTDPKFVTTTLSEVTENGLTGNFAKNAIYYKDVDGKWQISALNADSELILETARSVDMAGASFTYEFVYFLKVQANENVAAGEQIKDNTEFQCDLDCWQVD